MKIFNKCCCCSLRTGTKIIGYYEAISGGIICVIFIIFLFVYLLASSYGLNELEAESKLKNMTSLSNLTRETEVETKPQRALVAFSLLFYITYFLFYAILGGVLIHGVNNEKRNLINIWVKVKIAILILSLIPLVFRLFLLLFDLDSKLTGDIVMGIWDLVLIAYVYSYYEEMEEVTENPMAVL
ncbi:uncharacterized protein LOC106666314 [Cimex lectularius]|uniref:Uncharacterized protein n=1 Tax=Cimex lectularius TaxID=79782 RepID=A0A8I6RP07_CIMLE|nr:uncharacterized protein LOC106666314 [Cimex lectularius]XP_014248886.1 uncharacterized protein LOC106666314 [Cimex lectularius]